MFASFETPILKHIVWNPDLSDFIILQKELKNFK